MKVIGISGLDQSVAFKRREFPGLSERYLRIVQGLDSAAALVVDNEIVSAIAEERFTGEKHTGAFPIHSIESCLRRGRLAIEDIDAVAHGFCYKPYRRFFDLDPYLGRLFRKVYSRDARIRCLRVHYPSVDWSTRLIEVPHHLAHAASAFYLSGLEEALILVADGMGEAHGLTLAIGHGGDIKVLTQIPAISSIGILYSIVTLYLGFEFGCDEYKVMGLAPFGNPAVYKEAFEQFVNLRNNGAYTVPLLNKDRTLNERETHDGVLRELAGMFGPARQPGDPITARDKDVAAALQASLEGCLLHVLSHTQREVQLENLCMAGGVALNCVANGVIRRSGMFRSIFVQPAAGDDGTALGAALFAQRTRRRDIRFDRLSLPFWGPDYDEDEVRRSLDQRGWSSTCIPSVVQLVQHVATRIAQGQILGWFQGRMEFGPRALGNRSILADPRDPSMRARINQRIKKREDFRPFAPAVKAEAAHTYFDIAPGEEHEYAHMLFATTVKEQYRARLPAVTHVDGTARVQTVDREHHFKFWSLLDALEQVCGLPIVLNTSFNVQGQPMVRSVEEALDTFISAGLDALVIDNFVVDSAMLADRRSPAPPEHVVKA